VWSITEAQDDRERAGHARRQGPDEGDRSRDPRRGPRAVRDFATSIRSSGARGRTPACATRRPSCARQEEPPRAVARDQIPPELREERRRGARLGAADAYGDRGRPRARCCPPLPASTQQVIESDPTFMERVVEGALGLTLVEAENVFSKSAVRTHTFDSRRSSRRRSRSSARVVCSKYYEHREEFSDVGGMAILKDWLVKRAARSARVRATSACRLPKRHPPDRRAWNRQVAHREGGRRALADAAPPSRRRQDLRRPRR